MSKRKYFNLSLLNQHIKDDKIVEFVLDLVNKPQEYSSFVKERTFDEIAILLGVTRQRAEQIFQSGIKKFKKN